MIGLDKLVETINQAAEMANSTVAENTDQIINNFFDFDEETERYEAKTFNLAHPILNEKGEMEEVNVNIPLISIVPISTVRIEQLKFTTELEIALENDELKVSFSPSGTTDESAQNRPTATLEIMIQPQNNPEGLSKLIEGYDKVLRAQIPG